MVVPTSVVSGPSRETPSGRTSWREPSSTEDESSPSLRERPAVSCALALGAGSLRITARASPWGQSSAISSSIWRLDLWTARSRSRSTFSPLRCGAPGQCRSDEACRRPTCSGAQGAAVRHEPPISAGRPRPPRGARPPYSRRTSTVRPHGHTAFVRPLRRCGRRGRTRHDGTHASARPAGGAARRPRSIGAAASIPYQEQYRPRFSDVLGARL